MRTRWRRWRCVGPVLRVLLVLVPTAALFVPITAAAQGADDLALTIEQNLAGIAFRVETRPQLAAEELKEQKRQLQLLEQEAPDHAALPGLKEEFARVQDRVATELVAAASGRGTSQVPTAPEGFTAGMEEVDALQKRAEEEFLRGETGIASDYLGKAEKEMAALERRYQNEIPPGHVPLLVTKEKIAALKEQVADKEAE